MNIDIFIPARLESKRLPKKHLEKLLFVQQIKMQIIN